MTGCTSQKNKESLNPDISTSDQQIRCNICPIRKNRFTKMNLINITRIDEQESIKITTQNMFIKQTHPYLNGKLIKTENNLYCVGNFKITHLNISYNRLSDNILKIIEKIIQYQQNICSADEGLVDIKIKGFDKPKSESIDKLMDTIRKLKEQPITR
ncbi:uncharacterized protein LOC126898858 isoform X1 [Daktulosphaira vitifoliae]|uniref:uncharacterized protein LOC126898858 isoform X1 n=1 Tax=Daktulosphaira vitifoliae TaxID=58002 RepID=UPI0021A9BAF2|nr:uncharacterized protein LOC126898858 isoform X1 [Daktulosphaira vitifoliae]